MVGELLLNRYQMLMRIGTGGMATVYKAKDKILNRYVAIKVLLPQFAHDEEFIKKFRREAQAAASLSHFNIVSIYDVGQDGDHHFIVMEYVQGKSLKELIVEKAPLPMEKAANITCQISHALMHAHENNVIHRDIKPQNIIITPEGNAKVTDFGIARAVSESTQTYTSSVVGSAHYFSPEQAKGSYTGEQSDIYSLGIVLYEMMTAHIPFDGGSPISTALKHIQDPPHKPSEYNEDIPAALESIIMKSLEKDQAARYQNVSELMVELKDFLKSYTSDSSQILDSYNYIPSVSGSIDESPTQEIPPITESSPTESSQEDDMEGDDMANNKRKKKKSKKNLQKILIPLMIIAILVGGIYWGFNQLQAFLLVPEVEVPDVEEESLSEAERILSDEELSANVIGEEPHPEIAAGKVVRQDPESGRVVRQNRTIELIISEGPEYLEVPDVTGSNERRAIIELEQSGFEVDIEEEYNDEVQSGTVVSQTPSEGGQLREGSTVEIEVSLGGEPFEMPNFVGDELDNVLEQIDEFDLEIRNQRVDDDVVLPREVVTDQWPDPDEEVQAGDRIDLWVSETEGEEEELETHIIEIEKLPTDRQVRITVDDYFNNTVVFEDVPGEETIQVEGQLKEGNNGICEVYVEDEDGEYTLAQIIPFPRD